MTLPQNMIYLSWGMGVESSAILTRWLLDPTSRDFPLSDLTVITAQTGDEHKDTRTLCETHLFPLMRKEHVRLVQVARAGHLEEDGIEVLDDTDQPETLYIDGAYRLSDELSFAGTVPQFAGVHKCALKFKAFVLEKWLAEESHGEPYRHAFGYNADETKRIDKSEYSIAKRVAFGFNAEETGRIARANEYDSVSRASFYPLMDWGWTRADCLLYLLDTFGAVWQKSACVYCPFNAMKGEAVERLHREPDQVAQALLLEYTSLCFNHRSTLYRDRSLMSIVRADNNQAAIDAFKALLENTAMAIYRVRRIMTSKGHGHRCTEQIDATDLGQVIIERGLTANLSHQGDYDIQTGFAIERELGTFPAREEFYVRAPATVGSRARYGIPWFDAKWNALSQETLF